MYVFIYVRIFVAMYIQYAYLNCAHMHKYVHLNKFLAISCYLTRVVKHVYTKYIHTSICIFIYIYLMHVLEIFGNKY